MTASGGAMGLRSPVTGLLHTRWMSPMAKPWPRVVSTRALLSRATAASTSAWAARTSSRSTALCTHRSTSSRTEAVNGSHTAAAAAASPGESCGWGVSKGQLMAPILEHVPPGWPR